MERLRQLAYHDRARASREMGAISRELPPSTATRLDLLLSTSAAPEQGLQYFARLCDCSQAGSAADSFDHGLALSSRFHVWQFLSGLRHPEWVNRCSNRAASSACSPPEQMRDMPGEILPEGLPTPLEFALPPPPDVRILIRDVLGLGTLPEIASS
jgi:hypothetical protein